MDKTLAEQADAILEYFGPNGEHWCKGNLFRDEDGNATSYITDQAKACAERCGDNWYAKYYAKVDGVWFKEMPVQACLIGACTVGSEINPVGVHKSPFVKLLRQAIREYKGYKQAPAVEVFNDRVGTTFEDVKAVLEKAKEIASR